MQIGIKHHTHRPHQQTTGRQNSNPFVVEGDQTVIGHGLKLRPQLAEVTAKVDVEGLFDFDEFQAAIAD
ncbi:hypothetical protein D3C85_1499720 [compost metagenome]